MFCVTKPILERLLVPMINVRGLGSVVEAGRRWALDERGTRTSCEIYSCSRGDVGGGRGRGAVGASITSAESAGLTRIWVTIVR